MDLIDEINQKKGEIEKTALFSYERFQFSLEVKSLLVLPPL